ncbi:MAG: hypothetical protein FWD66_09350 [Paludibacter sp.]|nr:hypothetical protein [Paludibacter sp.]
MQIFSKIYKKSLKIFFFCFHSFANEGQQGIFPDCFGTLCLAMTYVHLVYRHCEPLQAAKQSRIGFMFLT